MTHTTQSRSLPCAEKAGETNTDHPEADNLSLLVSVCDSLNRLYTSLSKLDYAMKRKLVDINTHSEKQGGNKT